MKINLNDFLCKFVDDQVGLELMDCEATETAIAVIRKREFRTEKLPEHKVDAKAEYKEMAEELIEKLARDPYNQSWEITWLNHHGFRLQLYKNPYILEE